MFVGQYFRVLWVYMAELLWCFACCLNDHAVWLKWILSSFLQHRILRCFRQWIDFSGETQNRGVENGKNFFLHFFTKKLRRNFSDNFLRKRNAKLKLAAGNPKHLIYDLIAIKLDWLISGVCTCLCWKLHYFSFFAGLSADEHRTKTTCVTFSESKTIELKSGWLEINFFAGEWKNRAAHVPWHDKKKHKRARTYDCAV